MKTFKAKNLVAVFGVAAMAATLQVSAEEVAVPDPAPVPTPTPIPAQPPLQQTVSDLIDALVKQGTISSEQGDLLTKQLQPQLQSPAPYELPAPQSPDTLRVPYVPEAVKNAIRDEVRIGLREDLSNDIIGQARQERWGMPGVLPEWVDQIKIKGDLRLRHQSDLFADDNAAQTYVNFSELNRAGGYGKSDNPFLNTTENRNRERMRLRLGVDAKVNEQTLVGMRLATGNSSDPVSTNQTLGNTSRPYTILLEQAYLRYNMYDFDGYKRMTVWGGRMPNPWVSTDLVWDGDLNFEGVAATYRFKLGEEDGLSDLANISDMLFVTVGAFPLQEIELSSHDKWLLGAQFGGEWISDGQSRFTVALAYYDYRNIVGERNTLDSKLTDFTAPDFMQKGNTLFDIRNDTDVATDRWALASDYNEINLTMRADLASFSPIHVVLTGDYVKNNGFKEEQVSALTGYTETARTTGHQVQLAVGWPQITYPRDWRISAAYKHLERDAVVDAFTDSDFHLGGTDAEGWILGVEYGLMENTAFNFRWLSADAIDGPPLGVDVVQLDVNVKF
jgi:hypothetical protein